uniref:Uncharacterized protein n=1 Tax=Brassica oleracea var. oleracea TaxID=109376 RepID=A0A0D3BQL2_BRAOL
MFTSLCSDPSSMGHVESRVNQQGPPCKAKYSLRMYITLFRSGPAHTNPDELHLLGQAEVQPLEEEVEASAVEEEDSKKLSEKSESLELHRKTMDRKKMYRNHRQTTGHKLVWKELVKTNKEFFETYERKHTKNESMSEDETDKMIQKIISDSPDD